MSFDWRQFLLLSGDLLNGHQKVTEHQDACWRTVISRSYYAALHTAQSYCEEKDNRRLRKIRHDAGQGRDVPGRSHDIVLQWFEESRNKPEREAADTLRTLKAERVKADYHADKAISATTAQAAYEQAKELIAALDGAH